MYPIAFRGMYPIAFRGMYPTAYRGMYPTAYRGMYPIAYGGMSLPYLQRGALVRGKVATQLPVIELDGTGREVGHVVGVNQPVVVFPGVFLRQEEGLADIAVLVHAGQVKTGVEAIAPATAEDKPARVAAPVVETLRIVAVHFMELAPCAVFQVEQAEVGLAVPDGEVAVVGQGEHQVAAVIRRTGEGNALAQGGSVYQGIYLLTEGAIGWVEVNGAQVVAYFLVLGRNDFGCRRTEIKLTTIGRENGESLESILPLQQWRKEQFVGLGMIDQHVGSQVEDFDALVLDHMERLAGVVHRIGDVLARRMPVGIDAGRQGRVGLRVEQLTLAIVLHQRGAVRTAYMQAQPGRVGAVESMAVDAHTRHLGVFQQRTLFEGGEVALVDAHFAVDFVAGGYLAVDHAVVYGTGADVHGEGTELYPAVLLLDRNKEAEAVAHVIGQQGVPLVEGEGDGLIIDMQFARTTAGHADIYPVIVTTTVRKVHGSYTGGNGHSDIVGEDVGQFVLQLGRGHGIAASHQAQTGQGCEGVFLQMLYHRVISV